MSGGVFFWGQAVIPFREGESVAAALIAAGVVSFGADMAGRETRYFCGIGACQCCVVRIDGCLVEACLTPAREGLLVESAEADHA